MFPDSVTCEGDEAYLAQFAKISQGDLNPMCAALGNNLLITRYLIPPLLRKLTIYIENNFKKTI